MKILEEIQKHLKETPYSEIAQKQIEAFMMGKGYYDNEGDCEIEFKSEDNEFEDFVEWFEDEEEKESNQKVFFNYGVDLNKDILDSLCVYSYFCKSKKYKITGDERKKLIEKKEQLEKKNKSYKELFVNLSSQLTREIYDTFIRFNEKKIKDINALLNETVD